MINISVILPAYNAESSISGSVSSVLQSTFKDFELLIVDDGSTELRYNEAYELCSEYDFIIRLAKAGRIENLKEILTVLDEPGEGTTGMEKRREWIERIAKDHVFDGDIAVFLLDMGKNILNGVNVYTSEIAKEIEKTDHIHLFKIFLEMKREGGCAQFTCGS